MLTKRRQIRFLINFSLPFLSVFSIHQLNLTFLEICSHFSFTFHFIFSSCVSSTSVSSIPPSILQQKYQITQMGFSTCKGFIPQHLNSLLWFTFNLPSKKFQIQNLPQIFQRNIPSLLLNGE